MYCPASSNYFPQNWCTVLLLQTTSLKTGVSFLCGLLGITLFQKYVILLLQRLLPLRLMFHSSANCFLLQNWSSSFFSFFFYFFFFSFFSFCYLLPSKTTSLKTRVIFLLTLLSLKLVLPSPEKLLGIPLFTKLVLDFPKIFEMNENFLPQFDNLSCGASFRHQ